VRLVLGDDSVLLREGLARVLEDAGFAVLAQVGDADALLAGVEEHRPDVAVVDIRMPPGTDGGLRAAGEIRSRYPGVGVLVLSQYARPSYAFELLSRGADHTGYLLKDRVGDVAELADAVRRVGEGGSVLDPVIVGQLVGRPRAGASALDELSPRELEVLSLMAEGRTNQGIAARLYIAERTVEKHVNNILTKLQITPGDEDHRRVLAVLTYLRLR